MPNLRFPEFNGEWNEKALKEIGTFFSGGTPKTTNKNYYDGSISFIRSGEINSEKTELRISEKGLKNSSAKMVNQGDILIALYGATSGEIAISKINGAINQAILCFNTTENKQFCKNLWQKHMNTILETYLQGGQGNLSAEIIKQLKFKFPSQSEQNKIATFIETIEKRIDCQRKIIEGLQSFKVTVSKKIFSQELRFKDNKGENFPDWAHKILGDCLEYEQPTNYLVTSTEYQDAFEVPVVTAGKTFILGYTNETTGIFNENLPVIIFDDFTTATQFVTFPFKAKSSAMKILKAKNNVNIRFMYESMQMIKYEVGGHGRHWISVFAEMEVLIPCFAEQNQIATFLCLLDNKIDLETALLQQLKLQKQYLLQQLFI